MLLAGWAGGQRCVWRVSLLHARRQGRRPCGAARAALPAARTTHTAPLLPLARASRRLQIGAARREHDQGEQASFRSEPHGSGALPALGAGAGELPTAQLLAAVRALCDRLEAHAEVSYTDDDGRRVVDERIEEVPEALDRANSGV